MIPVRWLACGALGVFLLGGTALAQATNEVPAGTQEQEVDEKAWSFSASAYTYIVPDDRVYEQPTIMADRDRLHLEARYNYEGDRTGSLWVGYNISVGEKLALELTPMIGGVLGDTAGVAPGYRFSLGYGKLELASEGEFVFDSRASADSFFYNWSELSVTTLEWLRAGVVIQRTKLYESDFDVQRGVLVGLTYKQVDFSSYVFASDEGRPTLVLGLGLSF
jgi:hypothetical protein